MNSYRKFLAAIFAACFMTVSAFAADASPTGTWKWTQQGRGGGAPQERSITLELKDGKLTGQMNAYEGPQGEVAAAPISEASYKDGNVAFTVELTFGEMKFAINPLCLTVRSHLIQRIRFKLSPVNTTFTAPTTTTAW